MSVIYTNPDECRPADSAGDRMISLLATPVCDGVAVWRTIRLLLLGAMTTGILLFLFGEDVKAADDVNGIALPQAGATVHGAMTVEGTAVHSTFRKWQLDLMLDGDPERATFLAVSEDPAVAGAALSTVDTARYPNGDHILRLRVVHSNLNYDEYFTSITINNPVKEQPAPALPEKPAPSVEREQAPVRTSGQATNPAAGAQGTALSAASGPLVRRGEPPTEGRYIIVDLSEQTLTAWHDGKLFMETAVSTGRPQTPTVRGLFQVERKIDVQRMVGPGYNLPNVTSVMYFFSNYAIHAAYWHDNFGQTMSHGCVNMTVEEAAVLYNWAEIGTTVFVQD